jgi:limonene-1,2-epoxide hydrolase
MTRTPDQLVTEFCGLWANPEVERLAGFFAEDAVYHNMPLQPISGRAAITEFLKAFVAGYDGIDFLVHRQFSVGAVVMNERTDVLRRKDGVQARLPVAGVFEIAGDRIVAWRDYFDQAAFTAAFG